MTKREMTTQLPFGEPLPNGSEATDAVVGLFTHKDRMELQRKFKGQPESFNLHMLQKRLLRLGDLSGPVSIEVLEGLATPTFDHLLEACVALDMGYESVEAFRSSEEGKSVFGG